MDSESEERNYTFQEDPLGQNNRKLIDSQGHCYSIQNNCNSDGSSTWICRKTINKRFCKSKVKLTSDRKLIIIRDHSHPPDVKEKPTRSESVSEKEFCFKSKNGATLSYVIKHFPNKNSLKLYESKGHEYALKFQDAIGNSRWRCQYTFKGKLCPGQVCIIIEDNHQLSVLTEHFHTPFSSPEQFENIYEGVDQFYDTFSPITNTYSEDCDIVANFSLLQKQLAESGESEKPFNQNITQAIDKKEEKLPAISESIPEDHSKKTLFKFIPHKKFPERLLLCDSNGYAYDLIGKLGNNHQVYCCQELYYADVKCEAELLQDPNNQFIISSLHNHRPQDKLLKYLEKHNFFREECNYSTNGIKRLRKKSTPRTKKRKN